MLWAGKAVKTTIRLIIAIGLLALSSSALSKTLILSPDHKRALFLAEQLAEQLPDSHVATTLPKDRSGIDLVITIGNEFYLAFSQKITKPHIAAFVSYNTFKAAPNKIAIYSDPDPAKVAEELSRYFKGRHIGYVSNPEDEPYLKALKQQGLLFKEYPLVKNDIFKTLAWIFSQNREIDAFYVSENRDVYTPKNVTSVIGALARKRVPVIVSNKALKTKGAVLAIYTDSDHQIQKIAEVAKSMVNKKPLEKAYFVPTESAFNKRLARYLNLAIRGRK